MSRKESFDDPVLEYYYLTLYDLYSGVTFSELENNIKFYEEIENFEACAGIVKALKECQYYTIRDLRERIKEIEDEFRID